MTAQYNNKFNIVKKSTSALRGGFFFLFFLALLSPAVAQENTLTRVSVAERSDGKGYVVRYHLSQKPDSFKIYQPSPDLVQMIFYGEKLDTTGIILPETNAALDEIGFYTIPVGLGIDLYIHEDIYFIADAYQDGNSNDLLLGLSYSTKEELESYTGGLEPVIWSRFWDREDDLLAGGPVTVTPASVFNNNYQKLKSKMKFDVVVLDAGHGGRDVGAIGYKGTYEKNITLDIAKKVGTYLEEYLPDVKVVYTREDDQFIELEERGSIANRAEGDLFISIHCNANHSKRPSGTSVFFLGLARSETALEVMKRENSVIQLEDGDQKEELTQEDLIIYELANSGYIATSEKIAGMIEYQLDERAQRYSRGVKQAPFVVLYHASMPAILVEAGFITNPSEERYLTGKYGQTLIASAIFRAIRNYKQAYEKGLHLTTTN